MTRDDIIQWAKEAGFSLYAMHDVDGQDLGESVEADDFDALVRFAEAVAAAERKKRQPLIPLEAIKLGMKADDECRKHARGTTNWACAMTRFYEAAHNITGEPA